MWWEVIVGGVITVIVAIVFEYLRTPKLTLSIESPRLSHPPMDSFPARTYLRIVVTNRALRFIPMMRSCPPCRGEQHQVMVAAAIYEKPPPAAQIGAGLTN
jgi:hypothetical protein